MWTVISKTRKAIPGLAKILLALFLLGSIGFALYVQQVKKSVLKLDLDTPVQLWTDAGLIKLKLSSRWEKITESESAIGKTEIWSIPGNSKERSSGFFYLNLTPSQLMPNTQFLLIAKQNMWISQIRAPKIAQNTESTVAFPNFDVLALYLDSGREMILVSRMIYLPNGMTLSMTFITSSYGPIRPDYWLEDLAKTVEFFPNEQIHQARNNPSRKVQVAGVTLHVPAGVWAMSEAREGVLYLHPKGKGESDRWQARIKPMVLPAFRKPKAVLSDFFFDPFEPGQRVSFSEPSRMGGFTLYQAYREIPANSEEAEYRGQQLAYLLHRADGQAVLVTLETTADSKKQAQEVLRKVFTTIIPPPPVTTAQAGPDMKQVLSAKVITDQARDITGWFLVKQNEISIGFEAILVTAMPGAAQPELKVISFSFFDTDTARYQEDVRWQMKTDLAQGNYESHIKAQFEQNNRLISHDLISQNAVTPSSLDLKIKLDKDIVTETFQRPGDFLPNGSDQMLIQLMGRSDWSGPEEVRVSQFSDFRAEIETIAIRRDKDRDGRRRVFVLTDYRTDYTTHVFDEKGRHLGYYSTNGFSVSRTSPEEIQRLYPKHLTLARKRLAALAGGERPDRGK